MSKHGPIVIIDDDTDDHYFLQKAIESLNMANPLRFFPDGQAALDYLLKTDADPFIILCDINMPRMNGMELREAINKSDYLRRKSIPFVFLTTRARKEEVDRAYELTVQGFFEKDSDAHQLQKTLDAVLSYWKKCKHPNSSGHR